MLEDRRCISSASPPTVVPILNAILTIASFGSLPSVIASWASQQDFNHYVIILSTCIPSKMLPFHQALFQYGPDDLQDVLRDAYLKRLTCPSHICSMGSLQKVCTSDAQRMLPTLASREVSALPQHCADHGLHHYLHREAYYYFALQAQREFALQLLQLTLLSLPRNTLCLRMRSSFLLCPKPLRLGRRRRSLSLPAAKHARQGPNALARVRHPSEEARMAASNFSSVFALATARLPRSTAEGYGRSDLRFVQEEQTNLK